MFRAPGKILVKGKRLPVTALLDQEDEVSDEDEAADVEHDQQNKRPSSSTVSRSIHQGYIIDTSYSAH